MATDRQIAANRRNGALSRGPKTRKGKARSSRNARTHGLSIPVSRDKARRVEIEALARKLAQAGGGDPGEEARIAAEMEIELARVRVESEAVLERAAADGGKGGETEEAAALVRALPNLQKLDRYARRAL